MSFFENAGLENRISQPCNGLSFRCRYLVNGFCPYIPIDDNQRALQAIGFPHSRFKPTRHHSRPRIDIPFGADGLLGDFTWKPARWRRIIEMTACLAYHFGENGMAFLFRRAFGRDRFSGFEATLEDADFLKLQRNTAFS